jgi:hypothetical protein
MAKAGSTISLALGGCALAIVMAGRRGFTRI